MLACLLYLMIAGTPGKRPVPAHGSRLEQAPPPTWQGQQVLGKRLALLPALRTANPQVNFGDLQFAVNEVFNKLLDAHVSLRCGLGPRAGAV